MERYSCWWIKKPGEVELPPPTTRPIEQLREPLDGLACKQESCVYVTSNKDALRKHCKKGHALPWRGDVETLFEKVKMQTFFRKGGLQRYFIVRGSKSSHLSKEKTNVDKTLSEWRGTQRQQEKAIQIMDAKAAKTDRTGWFIRTGWLQHLAQSYSSPCCARDKAAGSGRTEIEAGS